MSESVAIEFTGERVIPGLVDADLFNEHVARYRFANRFAAAMANAPRVLDAGCGSGYGTAELICAASVTAADISADAIGSARGQYGRTGVRFVQASCEALPFPDAAFDMVVAFEVIEHLDRWQALVDGAKRVLTPAGVFLVSTPDRDYYAESRGEAGPNPFHRHEFSYEEFRQSLEAVFPHVRIWGQNHAEAIVFSPREPAGSIAETSGSGDPADAHFYFAAGSQSPIAFHDVFAWLPSGANVLRERERHIAKLNGELEKKDAWLRENIEAHSALQREHEALMAELERRNLWARELDREIARRDSRIGELANELEVRLAWVRDVDSQLNRARIEIARLQAESVNLENTLTERTLWAKRLDEELARIAASKWMRAGASLGIGPRVRDGK